MLSKKELVVLIIGGVLNSLTILLSSNGGPSNLSMVVSTLYVIYTLSRPLEQQLVLLSIALPNTKIFNYFSISGAVCICALSALFNYRKIKKISWPVVFLAFTYMLYCTQFYYRFQDVKLGFVMPIKTALTMLFFTILCSHKPISNNAYHYGFVSAMGLYIGIVTSIASTMIVQRSIRRLAVLGNDSNMLSVEVVFVLAYILVCFFQTKRIKLSFLFISVITLGFVCFLCGSRNGYLLFIIVVVYTYFCNMKRGKKSIIITLVIIASGYVVVNSDMGRNAIEVYNRRTQNLENKDDFSNGRYELWDEYVTVFNSDKSLWLYGLGSYKSYGINKQAHNFILEGIAGNGIIGLLILYFAYLLIYLYQFRRNNMRYKHKPTLFQYLPLLIPLLGGITLHGIINVMNTTMIYVSVLCLAKPYLDKSK